MKTRGPIWKVSIRTTSEAEDAVTELLQEFFGTPASSYTDVETREVTVAVYLAQSRRGGMNSQAGISSSSAAAASPSPIGWERAGVRACVHEENKSVALLLLIGYGAVVCVKSHDSSGLPPGTLFPDVSAINFPSVHL